jgi:hypothetical protein
MSDKRAMERNLRAPRHSSTGVVPVARRERCACAQQSRLAKLTVSSTRRDSVFWCHASSGLRDVTGGAPGGVRRCRIRSAGPSLSPISYRDQEVAVPPDRAGPPSSGSVNDRLHHGVLEIAAKPPDDRPLDHENPCQLLQAIDPEVRAERAVPASRGAHACPPQGGARQGPHMARALGAPNARF